MITETHNNVAVIKEIPQILEKPGSYTVKGVELKAILLSTMKNERESARQELDF